MRADMIIKNNRELTRKFHLGASKNPETLALISVLTDISETLAILTDLYAAVNRLEVAERTVPHDDPEP